MRRKSNRNASKASESTPDSPKKTTRRSRRRKRSTSASNEDSDDDTPLKNLKSVVDSVSDVKDNNDSQETLVITKEQMEEEKDQLTTNQESLDSEEALNKEELQCEADLKGCDRDDESGKGKSKSKTKSKIENPPHNNEIQIQTNSDISGTIQVTAQSPSIDIPVDNQMKHTDLGDDSIKQNVNENGENVEKVPTEEICIGEQNEDNGAQEEKKLDKEKIEFSKENNDTSGSCELKNTTTIDDKSNLEDKSIINSDFKTNEKKKISLRRRASSYQDVAKIQQSKDTTQNISKQVVSPYSDTTITIEVKMPKRENVKVKLLRNKYLKINKSENEEEKQVSEISKENEQNQENKPSETKECSKHRRIWELHRDAMPVKVDFIMLKTICPDMQILEEKDVNLDLPKERRKSIVLESEKKSERKVSFEYSEEERPNYEQQSSTESNTEISEEDKTNIIAFNRKISIVEDTASKLRPPPAPAKNPVSEVLYITNLVRPFTVKQLKELLERTGKIIEDGFWTDRIKSKCFVQYETQEEAEATRNALHGVNWPIGNGKELNIEYAAPEDLEKAKNPPPPPPVVEPKESITEKENKEPIRSRRLSQDGAEKDKKRRPDGHVREWDIGKEDIHKRRSRSREGREKNRTKSSERSHERSHERLHKHRRSPSPDDYLSKKYKKHESEEEIPQKLMDDLFLKTKATPSIYWQPLTPDEIATKQHQRLVRMEEHKRRMEVTSSRSRGGGSSRDPGRGAAYRRRFN